MKEFKELYKEKLKSPEELVRLIKPGTKIFTDSCLAEPFAISSAMKEAALKGELKDITVNTILEMYPTAWYDEECKDQLHGVSWFSGGIARKAVNKGFADIMPTRYVEMIENLRLNPDIDCLCVAVSPMDEDGYFSTGAAAGLIKGALEQAKTVFLDVNKQMPCALSAKTIHISQVTALCESDYPLPVQAPGEIDEVSKKIGDIIAAEVVDGSTLQLGIGAIPDAVGLALKNHKNLGIHTELLTDSMIELVECGAVTNTEKPIHTGKTVATISYGAKRVYDYIHNNPDVEMLPVYYVNDINTIAAHPNFVSVNSAIEVDLFGQVCAESVGTRHISGSGGQWEYVRGSTMSKGGKSFIAFSSTTKGPDGIEVSRIKPILTPGAIVTTTKNDVDYIVTEYGARKLRGKTLSQRAAALIEIAHPDFREELTREAIKIGLL